MMKLCPSWKVYQGWMGCDPFDSIAIPLCEVTVNNVYENLYAMNLASSYSCFFQMLLQELKQLDVLFRVPDH